MINRAAVAATLAALARSDDGLATAVAPDARFLVAHPVDECEGRQQIAVRWLHPLREAFASLHRRDDILIGGTSRTGSGEWVAAMGHYVGNFERPLFGVAPHGHLAFLRYGEFYRIERGMIAEARILVDLPDLARQVGRPVLPQVLGAEIQFPAPATHDGVRLRPSPSPHSDASAALVEAMLNDLRPYDPATFDSAGQSGRGGYWHEDMLWYGPCGIGSNLTYAGFQKDHRIPFLKGFPDRVGGNHYARFGDGDYVCSGGWPSLTGTHLGDYLGVAATGARVGMRVMDFWRCAGGQIMENWVFIDMPDLFMQMGVDILARPPTEWQG